MRKYLIWLITAAAMSATMTLLAGRWDLPRLWVYAVLFSFFVFARVKVMDPALAREENRAMPGRIDRFGSALLGIFFAAHIIVACLDVGRFHWADNVTPALGWSAMIAFAVAMNLDVWARAVNNFFTLDVRLQRERDHRVITRGPYRYVRHPGYVGAMLSVMLSGLALGSWLSLVPAACYCLVLVRRTAIEDRFLKANLEGYAGYTDAVRYRLVPGLW